MVSVRNFARPGWRPIENIFLQTLQSVEVTGLLTFAQWSLL